MSRIKTRDKVKDIKTVDRSFIAKERLKRSIAKARRSSGTEMANDKPEDFAEEKTTAVAEEATAVAVNIGTKVGLRLRKNQLLRNKTQAGRDIPAINTDKVAVTEQTGYTQPIEPINSAQQEYITDLGQQKLREQARKHTDNVYVVRVKDSVDARVYPKERFSKIKTVNRADRSGRSGVPIVPAVKSVNSYYIAEVGTKRIKAARQHIAKIIKEALIASGQRLMLSLFLISQVLLILLVAVFICVSAVLTASSFGIFFSGEDSGTGQTVQTSVAEINAEYYDRLEAIQDNNSYDLLDISGIPADWIEVLAVYAVKTTSADDGQEVATMNDEKKQLLKTVFWDMTHIKWQLIPITDTTTLLSIEISHKSAADMIVKYNFNAEQHQQLAELLDEQHRDLWQEVLYGSKTAGGNIVTVAMLQVGNVGGEVYWSWYGFESKVNWCACFVSWCAEQCGYIEAGIVPKFAGCVFGVNWFKNSGLWQDNGYTPASGDIIFFDWDDEEGQDGISDHTGIVQKVENGMVYTIEGNAADACRIKSYPLGYYEILGYGTPRY